MGDWFEKVSMGTLVDRAAERFGDREALYYEGKRWSFAALKAEIDTVAKGLLALGIQPGEKVSLWMPNRSEWVSSLFAVIKIGAILVPINTRFRTADLEYVMRQSDSSTLITVDRSGPVRYGDMVGDLCPDLDHGDPDDVHAALFPGLRRIVVLGEQRFAGTHAWSDMLARGETIQDSALEERQRTVDPDATALIMYTSGTTGFPKGVMHNHNILRTITDKASRVGVTSRDVILMYLPLFHAFGLYEGPLMIMVTGARMVLTTLFDPAEALALIAQEKATLLHGFDTHFHDLMEHPTCATTDLRSLRTGLLAAGMASSEPVARRAQRLICPTLTGWGMTEVGVGALLSFLDSSEDDRCLGSGWSLPGYEFKVIDPTTGQTLPPGTMGELCTRGYGVMQGYYKKPEETAKVIDPEGWLHTGDMATMRDDGMVRFLGRYKEILKVGGENVDPVEVEAFLLQHPSVNQVKIVGVPDARLNEVGAACVVLHPGMSATPIDLIEFCRGKLAGFKVPRHVLFVKEFPMTSSGKVQRFRLRELAMDELQLEDA
ncbi:MAG TPA: AMP-binding protein [Candidatus Tectomicrobia bacterium]|nr:AMP-binding protein [Candidatus Tectomicrobia bacterium]